MIKSQPFRLHRLLVLWRDERFLRLLGQIVFLVLVATFLGYLARNMFNNLRQQGMGLGFDFLSLTAGFDIGEHFIPYDRSHTFLRAFEVGLLNTALVAVVGIFFATILGAFLGIARLSSNFLIQSIARAFIEFLRNMPLLVLLFFLYTGVFIQFPKVKQAIINGLDDSFQRPSIHKKFEWLKTEYQKLIILCKFPCWKYVLPHILRIAGTIWGRRLQSTLE